MKNLNKLLLSTLFLTSCITSLNAQQDKYIGLKLSKLDSDKTVVANTSGYAYIGPYDRYDDFSLIGIEGEVFNYKKNSPFLWGFGGSIMLNDGKLLYGGGLVDFNINIGAHFDKIKAYGIFGAEIQSLSEYTGATGIHFGIGATYDIQENFGFSASYTQHNMTTFTSEDNDWSDDQDYTLSGFSLAIQYKY